jgi:hypothetical protein
MTWPPGKSGNPEGRRLGKPITDAIGQELAMMADGRVDKVPATSLRMAIRRQIQKASKGDLRALEFLADRCEGKPKTIVAGDSEEPIQLALSRGEDARERIAAALTRIASANVVPGLIEGKTDSKD